MMWPRVVNCCSLNSYCSAVTMIRPIQIKSIAALALLIAAAGIVKTALNVLQGWDGLFVHPAKSRLNTDQLCDGKI